MNLQINHAAGIYFLLDNIICNVLSPSFVLLPALFYVSMKIWYGCTIYEACFHTIKYFASFKVFIKSRNRKKSNSLLFFEVPPLTSDELLENVLQTVCRKLQKDSGTGVFELGAPFSWL